MQFFNQSHYPFKKWSAHTKEVLPILTFMLKLWRWINTDVDKYGEDFLFPSFASESIAFSHICTRSIEKKLTYVLYWFFIKELLVKSNVTTDICNCVDNE